MTDPESYSPVEICQMLNVAKTTLYRWEQEKKISSVQRDRKGERRYTRLHVKQLAEIQLETLKRQYVLATSCEDTSWMGRLLQEISRIKILFQEDPTGLRELREYANLSDTFVGELLRKAADLKPSNTIFLEIIDLLYHTFIDKK